MNGKNRGVMILKNGGASGNEGGNRISKIIEFNVLKQTPVNLPPSKAAKS